MNFMKKIKKARGVELIEKVAEKFGGMIEELDQGADDCREEQVGIRMTVEQLKERDTKLGVSVSKASTIASNLRAILGA